MAPPLWGQINLMMEEIMAKFASPGIGSMILIVILLSALSIYCRATLQTQCQSAEAVSPGKICVTRNFGIAVASYTDRSPCVARRQ
jgi:hypothetical protein